MSTFKPLLLSSLIAFSSCIANFERYNTHPTDPHPDDMTISEKAGVLFPGMLYLMHNVQENDNQMIEQMVGNQYGGYMSTTNEWNGKNFGTFNPNADWVEKPFVRTFSTFYANYLQIKKITESKGYIHAWANIIRVAVMLRITDTYGPIPYSKIGGGQMAVEYDAMQDVYHHMINDLNSSIVTLAAFAKEPKNGRTVPIAEFDLVYKGDFLKWIRFANSLKLRMSVRIGLVDEEYAGKVMNDAIDGGLILSNDDNAFLPTSDNPYYKSAFNWQDVAVSATLSAYMNGWNDPRRPAYMTMTGKTYKGVRMGIENIDKEIYGSDAYSKPNFKTNSPLPVYCAAETYFLLAEAALRGWIPGDAKDLYEQGIHASMEQHEADMGNYLTVTANPEPYHDPNNANLSFDLSSPSAGGDVTVAWDRATTDAARLEVIITQKWIANFPLGFEAWCDFRRTGYPRLMPAAANLSSSATGGWVNDIRMARRLPYPVSEYNTNPVHVQNAVTHLLRGQDEFSTDLWWAKTK